MFNSGNWQVLKASQKGMHNQICDLDKKVTNLTTMYDKVIAPNKKEDEVYKTLISISGYCRGGISTQDITYKEAIDAIVSHLGIEFSVANEARRVIATKKSKPKVSKK